MPIDYETKKGSYPEVKEAIAVFVWDEILAKEKNPQIWIDAGTSAEEVAAVIAMKWQELKHAPTVVTNNLGAWERIKTQEGSENLDIYLVGGRYNRVLNAMIELRSYEDSLKRWHPNIVVIAVSGINDQQLYCSNVQDESPVKRALATKSVEKRIIIADHTKIGRTDFGGFLELNEVGNDAEEVYLVTNRYAVSGFKEPIRREKYERTIAAFKTRGHVCEVPVDFVVETRAPGKPRKDSRKS